MVGANKKIYNEYILKFLKINEDLTKKIEIDFDEVKKIIQSYEDFMTSKGIDLKISFENGKKEELQQYILLQLHDVYARR